MSEVAGSEGLSLGRGRSRQARGTVPGTRLKSAGRRDSGAVGRVRTETGNRLTRQAVVTTMRRRLTLLLALAAPFVLAGCGKGKY